MTLPRVQQSEEVLRGSGCTFLRTADEKHEDVAHAFFAIDLLDAR